MPARTLTAIGQNRSFEKIRPLEGGKLKHVQEAIKRAAEKAFQSVRRSHPQERFCGYALYSDADAMTVCPSVNTEAHFARMVRSNPSNAEYYRWSPAEWSYEFEGAEHFSSVIATLADLAENTDDTSRKNFKNMVYENCVVVLEQMRAEGFFSDIEEPGVLVFTVSDSFSTCESHWIDRLNSENSATQFRRWYETAHSQL